MEGNRQLSFKKRPNSQFKKKGGNNKKGKWHNSSREQSYGNSDAADTVYRVLCPAKKIGGVIGKGGGIVKALREQTQAKITVADSVPGTDERVILIYSSTEIPRQQNTDTDQDTGSEQEAMEPHCPAQDALLKVHERIVEEDLSGAVAPDNDNEIVVTTRLLVPNNMVGCLIGKGGDVIQRLRSETGASIRVLPSEHLPTCAMNTDELVQISGIPAIAKRALYVVSTLLHQNRRRDKPPLSFIMPFAGQGFRPPGGPMTMFPPGNPMWPPPNSNSHDIPPMPWVGGYKSQPSGFVPGGFDGVPPGHGEEALGEFSMKILCSTGKIGGVIGKGGFNVKQLQQETGASIHVEDASTESEERVIRASAFETLWNPRSQTIDAILQLQNKTSDFSEKGIITTRLLVPSSKVGCIIGQGGHVINEMRRRTSADIRVYSKDDKPKFASEDEELVQISGNFGVAKDALAEIASRLRLRTLRDGNGGGEPALVGPMQGFGPAGSLPVRGPPTPSALGVGSSGGYEPVKGGGYEYEPGYPVLPAATGYEYEPRYPVPPSSTGYEYESRYPVPPSSSGYEYEPRYPVPSASTGYPTVNRSMEPKIPNMALGSVVRAGGSNIPNFGEVTGAKLKLQDAQSGGSECVVEIRGSSEHLTAAQSILQAFMASGGQQGSYQNTNNQQVPYQTMDSQQASYQNMSAQQNMSPYQNYNAQQGAMYQNTSMQQGSYQY